MRVPFLKNIGRRLHWKAWAGAFRNRNEVRNYRDLLVWRRGIDLVKKAYVLTGGFPRTERFGLVDQVRRAAVSVPSNIAEGHARQHGKEFRQFLYVSLGSLAELDTQLTIATELGYMAARDAAGINSRIVELRRMINGLLKQVRSDR